MTDGGGGGGADFCNLYTPQLPFICLEGSRKILKSKASNDTPPSGSATDIFVIYIVTENIVNQSC